MEAQPYIGFVALVSTTLLVLLALGGTPNAVKAVSPSDLLSANLNAGWEEVGANSASGGGISNNSGGSYHPAITIASDDTSYIAWDDSSGGDYEIYVRRWNGTWWEEVGAGSASGGGISDDSGDSVSPSIAIAPNGTLYVAWYNTGIQDEEIYVRRWNGGRWEEVGTGSASGGGISDNDGDSVFPSVAIAPDGMPYVAWADDSSGGGEVYVRRWNGSWWEEVGTGSASGAGISNSSGWSSNPSLVIAPNGTPYVAWDDATDGDYEIYVRRWSGSWWEEVGTDSASGGGISDDISESYSPSVAVALDDTPYVAWYDYGGWDDEIYVRRWNGSWWEEVGTGSASGGGISNNNGISRRPLLGFAPDGALYVAWYDRFGSDVEIYVRRWKGTTWEEVGRGSASGGGISDTSGGSYHPAMKVASDGTPYVAWYDYSGGNAEIYVRRLPGGHGTLFVYLPILLEASASD